MHDYGHHKSVGKWTMVMTVPPGMVNNVIE